MVADGAPCYPVVVVVGCVTRGTTGREKETFAGGRVGERDSLVRKIEKGVGLASGRDLNVWRLARSGAQYCAPKATLEDHITLEMEPSGLNAPRTCHSECHTFRAPLSGFLLCQVYTRERNKYMKRQAPMYTWAHRIKWGDLTSPVRTYGIKCGCKPVSLLHRPHLGHSHTKNLTLHELPSLW